MNSIYLDLILSGVTYVILTYLSFMLMKRRKARLDDDDEGGQRVEERSPKIDLPPGVGWSGSPKTYQKSPEEVY
ncbi:MAG: hypothetical protein ACJAXX_000077 [Roseivirga sp.]|jgi:hypothetical protein